jgi:uncharacterized membrane protein
LLQEYKALIELVGFIVVLLGVSLPEWEIWDHYLLAWNWPSRTVLVVIGVFLVFAYCTYTYIISLQNEIQELKKEKEYSLLAPEKKAELVSKKFNDMGRFIGSLLNKEP